MVRTVLAGLMKARPDARIILGGPQVMNYGIKYLAPSNEQLVICNGEGERTFQHCLKALLSAQPDLTPINRGDILAFDSFFARLADFIKMVPDAPLAAVIERSIQIRDGQDDLERSKLIHCALHEHRSETARLLWDYITAQEWWQDERAQLLYEVDQLRRPYLYSNALIDAEDLRLRHIQLLAVTQDGYLVRLPEASLNLINEALGGCATFPSCQVCINQRRMQHQAMTEMPPVSEYLAYCVEISYGAASICPIWSDATAAIVESGPRQILLPVSEPQRWQLPVVQS